MALQFIVEEREDSFNDAVISKVIRKEVGQMEVKFQKPRGEAVKFSIPLKMCFIFLVSCFLLSSYIYVPHIAI